VVEQADDMPTGFFAESKLGWRDALPKLAKHVIDLQTETRRVEPPRIDSGLLGNGGRMQGEILHQFNHIGRHFKIIVQPMDGDQRRPHSGPAADQIQIAHAVAVGAGNINQ